MDHAGGFIFDDIIVLYGFGGVFGTAAVFS